MAKLVNDHVVDKLVREFHECDIEADRTGRAAATPAAAGMRKSDLLVMATEFFGHECQTFGQITLCLKPERGFDFFADLPFYG